MHFNSCVDYTLITSSNLTLFSFLFYFSIQENRENFPNQENIDLLSMPSKLHRKSDAAQYKVLHLEDKDEEARDSDSFTTQQLFSFAWQIARGMVMDN